MVRRTAARRAGFTLIELLFVIAIISILVGLLLVGINAARGSGKRYQTVSEINQLEIACNNFKNDFKAYPPTPAGGFTVPKIVNSNDPSYAFLRKMFPHWIPMKSVSGVVSPADDAAGGGTGTQISATVDANGTSYGGALTSEGVTLDANQALVYFLAGPTLTGWNPAKPYPPAAAATTAKGPYYDFPTARLKSFTTIWPNQALPWFVDPYGSPYCYFATPNTRIDNNNPPNGTATLLQFPLAPGTASPKLGPDVKPAGGSLTSDRPPNASTSAPNPAPGGWIADDDRHPSGKGTIVVPFFVSATKAQNAKGVQIVSAGPDQRFGPGDVWQPGQGSYSIGGDGTGGVSPGGDDVGNFNGGTLSNEK